MNAEVVYLIAFDIAQEADLRKIRSLISDSAEGYYLGRVKDAPSNFPSYNPVAIRREPLVIERAQGSLQLLPSIKIFSFGALSVRIRVPVTCHDLNELMAYRELSSSGLNAEKEVMQLVHEVFEHVKPALDNPVAELPEPEGYTVFCLANLAEEEDMEKWLGKNERDVAALLVGEQNAQMLSRQEVEDTTRLRYSYYKRDLAVIDWDAALLVDTPQEYGDTLFVMEVANVQLEELKTYDQKLDLALDKAYDDVERTTRPYVFAERRRVLQALREIRMDLAKVSDEISNSSKFFGDWHMARIYMGCASKFHLSDWENVITQKLRALDNLYTMLQQESGNLVMLLLEASIVGLFIIDLIIIIILGSG